MLRKKDNLKSYHKKAVKAGQYKAAKLLLNILNNKTVVLGYNDAACFVEKVVLELDLKYSVNRRSGYITVRKGSYQ